MLRFVTANIASYPRKSPSHFRGQTDKIFENHLSTYGQVCLVISLLMIKINDRCLYS